MGSEDATFITCISAWPDIEDRSTPAGLARVVVYFLWFLHVVRNMGVFLIIHTALLCLSQQYKNLQGYFEDLNKIFDERDLSQEEKEAKFEVKFKKGIEQHALTLWCVDETQRVFQVTFSSHVLLWCGLLMSCLPEVINSDTHSLTILASNAPRMAAALVGLGYFMWPAGDITVEASILPQAMYGSGWQSCRDSSSRIRKLVVLAMMQAQRPIELKAFGHLTFSYETYVAEETRNLLYQLVVVLKRHHNDAVLEREMIKKIKVFSISLSGLVCIVAVLYGVRALYRVVAAGENFITIAPAWPDVHEESTVASVMRVFFYFWWFPFAARVMFTFLMFVAMLLAICYQFKNLQCYFYSLNDIFSDNKMSQEEKELKYERAFKVGIQMHSHTLWCKKQHQYVSKEMFAIEIILFFGMLLTQLATLLGGERTLSQLSTMILMSISTCLSLGFFMWNGGDITIEASKLSEAMYSSGWQNCYGQSSVRVRKLVVSAIRQAQVPVVYKTLGIVEFSYESYVSLVKMTYTAVSVFY